MEARRLAAEVLVQFTKAADASNRAVMANTDEMSAGFALEAAQATQEVLRNAAALKAMLAGFDSPEAVRLLDDFDSRFAAYQTLDRSILELAAESSNLKAQRLSFGPAREAADAFRDALAAVVASARAEDAWQVKALAAMALSAVREIQVLQAPHIAEAEDAGMTRMEQQMAASAAAAKGALAQLATLVQPSSQPMLATATSALDRFSGLNTQLIAMSRRNTNVRSLALSLSKKRTLTASCEDCLRAVQETLAKRGFAGTR